MTTIPTVSRANALVTAQTNSSARGRLIDIVREWRRRSRSRRELLALGERDLRDVRLTRCDAESEGVKPFWQE